VLDNISQIPKTEAHVLGVMTLRNRLLPLVSLRQIFRLPAEALNEHNRIVVVSVDSAEGPLSVGVVMDTVNEVLRVQRSLVEPLPTLLARDGESQEILSICRLDEGKRLVSILSAQKMFKVDKVLDAVKAAHGNREEATMDERQESAKVDDEEQFVVFRLADEEYGVPIDSVQEIVRVPEQLTHVPKAPGFIEGVVNLRGSVLPVVDQCRRFGLASPERNDRQRIMVFSINGVRTGFIVDSVSEVLKIAKSTIEPAPSLSDEQAKVIRRVANLEKQQRMILLLEVDNLLDKKEAKAVEKVEKGDKADKAEKVH
jgi:purine-binding chemotaxis protein CheW